MFYFWLCHCFNLLRLNPKNEHQRPTVVLLCGPHLQGAQGVSCARHLANHDVEVVLFLPSFLKMQPPVCSEVDLYSKTSGRQVDSVKGRKHLSPHCTQDQRLDRWRNHQPWLCC